jgi:hypothetical protein
MIKNFAAKFPRRQLFIGIGIIVAVAAIVTFGVVNQAKQQANTAPKQESAYANVIKDSLNVYYARYEKYPESYQALLGDINKTPEIYGVNDEGMEELTHIGSRLGNFSYSAKSHGAGYEFTYTRVSGSVVTVKSE